MKVLPANLDDFNDIEKIGDEFYFRKDTDAKSMDADNNNLHIDSMNDANIQHHSTVSFDDMKRTVDSNRNIHDAKNDVESGFDDTNNVLREVRSTLGYDQLQKENFSISIPTLDTQYHPSTVNFWDNEYLPPNTNIYETLPIDEENNIVTANENQVNDKMIENLKANANRNDASNGFTLINTNRAGVERKEWENDEDYYDESYEDYSVEVKGPKISRKNKIRIHTSYQKTAIRQPLLQQGFIASPGYPKYYIGSNCSWRISVPSRQRIRLILLDVHLRCRYLKIMNILHSIFNSIICYFSQFQTTRFARIIYKCSISVENEFFIKIARK